jgi:hypothetical protein
MTIPSTSIETTGIASVLKSTKLEVPVYQRSFEWTEEVQELLEDIGEAFSRNKEEYFLGSLVVINAPEGERTTLLDGQQRLAVISLLLAGIADQFDDRGDKKRSGEIRREYLTKYDIIEGTEHPQLKLNLADDMYFRAILNREGGEPDSGAPASHQRLWQACETISNWLSKKVSEIKDPIKWLSEFSKYLDTSAYVIYFGVADDANAFLIFETMNDRGLDLSIADLLKNYLLGHAGEDLQTVLNLWNTANASLRAYGGENLFTVFLRHFWSSKHGLVREKDLYRNIKSRISTSANVTDFTNELANNSNFYAAILSPDHEFWSEASAKAREHIGTLSRLGLEQYRPMLLSTLAHLQMEDVENLLRLLISWSVRLLIVGGLGGGVIENNYCVLAQDIRNGKLKTVREIANRANKSFVPNDSIFRDSFANARVSKASLARYYLQTLELEGKGEIQPELVPNINPNELTLEHVLPERPAEDAWTQFDEEEKKAYTKRLGNMLLLKQKMNSTIRSSPFNTKRKIYAQSDLLLTKKVAKAVEWTKETIKDHQNYLAELAVKAWKI